MKLEELMSQVRDAMTVKRVFGEPFEKDGTTVIPVATIMGGVGGGEGSGPMPASAGEEQAVTSGSGAGFGVRATPAGVYVIRDGDLRWLPALGIGRIVFVGQLVAVVFLLVVPIDRPRSRRWRGPDPSVLAESRPEVPSIRVARH